jgi:hypothetical protein
MIKKTDAPCADGTARGAVVDASVISYQQDTRLEQNLQANSFAEVGDQARATSAPNIVGMRQVDP